MSISKLPERASLDYLRKLAKDRLRELRQKDPRAQLAAAQLLIAREHGLPSWRALRAQVARQRYDIVELLIDLGADLEVEDASGHTPLATAMLRGDSEAMSRLRAAGAREPDVGAGVADVHAQMATAANAVRRMEPMLRVPDVGAAVAWYLSAGFAVEERHEDGGELVFAKLSIGAASFALSTGGTSRDVTLWFTVDGVDGLYRLFRQRQLRVADVRFLEELYKPFYGGWQFSVADLNGVALVFHQPGRSSTV